jgi:hypothetical protein
MTVSPRASARRTPGNADNIAVSAAGRVARMVRPVAAEAISVTGPSATTRPSASSTIRSA